jgi:hypothetical protein
MWLVSFRTVISEHKLLAISYRLQLDNVLSSNIIHMMNKRKVRITIKRVTI